MLYEVITHVVDADGIAVARRRLGPGLQVLEAGLELADPVAHLGGPLVSYNFV